MFYFYTTWKHQKTGDFLMFSEVRNSGITKSSYETELRKMTPNFEIEIENVYRNSSFELLTRLCKILN